MLMAARATVQEKRKHPRVPVNLPAVYRSVNLTTDVYVSNISQGGAFVACPSVDGIGTHAELLVSIPGRADPLRLVGTVTWVHRMHPRPGMGITFAQLARDQRLALANFLIARFYEHANP
jgi:uncharacterized protein (TIGR02266 family)